MRQVRTTPSARTADVGIRVGLLAGLLLAALSAPASSADTKAADGARIYNQYHCSVCHGGLGGGGFGRRLAGDPMLAIDKFPVAQILIGRGQMPAFADKLSNEQIAAVAQYIRNSWGNNFGPISPQTVAETRDLMTKVLQTTGAPQ